MLSVLANRVYRRLFLAQVSALLGSGLATVALALLAFDLAGDRAGAVLGTALAIKMVAYVGVAPIAGALAVRLPRRAMLVTLDVVRAIMVAMLPFVTEVWHVYVLIFALQSASAAFTPTFQAAVPEILPDEEEYTKALSLSRLAHDLENLASPLLAAILLTVLSFHILFAGTAIGFLVSAVLVLSAAVPSAKPAAASGLLDRSTRGIRIFAATPRLRGLMGINLAVAASGAMVIVNTVVFVQQVMGLREHHTALALAAFGAGSMIVAFAMPGLLHRFSDRFVMLTGALTLAVFTGAQVLIDGYVGLLALWTVLGAAYSASQLPTGRLLRRSAHAEDLPPLFAAQFALSHACWLIAYPLAGWFGTLVGLPLTAMLLSAIAAAAALAAWWLWPANDTEPVEHEHPDLPPDHPHLATGGRTAGRRHRHTVVIDELHPVWPQRH